MADPLSIAASIAGLLKLGTDVGVGLAKFCSAARAAPSLLKEVSEGLPLLCGALRRLEVLLPELQMSAVDLESLERLLKQCNGSLCELKTVVGTLQSTFDKGGHQKMWLQATWPAKEEEISSLWAKLSDYKSTLALTLQVQQASDIIEIKNAIKDFLAAQNESGFKSPGRKEVLERCIKSASESLYSKSGSAELRTAPTVFGNLISERTNPEPAIPLSQKRALPSSETLRQLEMQKPPAPMQVDLEFFWASLVPELQLTSPAPYSSFQELYMSIYHHLWLHGRIWLGDRPDKGTLLISRYNSESGEIELSRLLASKPSPDANPYEVPPKVWSGDAILGLKSEALPNYQAVPYSLSRITPIPPESQDSKMSLWPPPTVPAKDHTSRTLPQLKGSPKAGHLLSNDLFKLKKRNRINLTESQGFVLSEEVEVFSALDPKLYTPDLEHPLRGIWTKYSGAHERYEFLLFQQPTRNRLEGIKLTGSSFIPRGELSFVFEDLGADISCGKLKTSRLGYRKVDLEYTMQWVGPNEVSMKWMRDRTWLNDRYLRVDIGDFI